MYDNLQSLQSANGVNVQSAGCTASSASSGRVKLANVECAICLETGVGVERPHATRCGHIFCYECISACLSSAEAASGKCPTCRTPCTMETIKQITPIADHEGSDRATVAHSVKELKLEMKSKFKLLLEKLKEIKDEDATSKTLIFTQFNSTIEWLKPKLEQAGFSYRTLSGSMSRSARTKALADFQNDPPTTVFILSVRSGAVGINLTQANKVILLEPCFNNALEAQAIGRVHRMGQTRTVVIYRFFMAGSIEEVRLSIEITAFLAAFCVFPTDMTVTVVVVVVVVVVVGAQ